MKQEEFCEILGGVNEAYVQQARLDLGAPPVRQLKIGNAYPFPEELAETFLREVDQVAYVRFASVYRQFKDIDTFMAELNKLLSEK